MSKFTFLFLLPFVPTGNGHSTEPIRIVVGDSISNTKTLTVSFPETCYQVSPFPDNTQDRMWSDTFGVSYDFKTRELTVKRIDEAVGWTQQLVLLAQCHNEWGVPCASHRILYAYESADKLARQEKRLKQIRFNHLPTEKDMYETCKKSVFGMTLCRNAFLPASGEVCGTRTLEPLLHMVDSTEDGKVYFVDCDIRAHCY